MSFDALAVRVALFLSAALTLGGCSEGNTDPLAELVIIADANITAVDIVAAKTTIAITETLQLQATNGAGGADITDDLSWTSSNPGVAAVTGAGIVDGIAEGTATITAQIGDIAGAVDLTVSAAPIVSVAVNAASPADACDDIQFSATAMFADGRDETVTGEATWQSSDAVLADFDAEVSGLLHTTASGNVDITATVRSVTSDVFPLVISDSLAAVTIVAANTTVEIDATEQLTADGDYSDGSTRPVSNNVTWNSPTPAVATIDEAGLLTGVASGTVEITATCSSLVGRQTFTIGTGDPSVVDLEVDGTQPFTVPLGTVLQLTLTAEFSDGTTQDVTEDAEWSVVLTLGSGAISVSNVAGTKGLLSTNSIGVSVIRATYEGEEELIEVDAVP